MSKNGLVSVESAEEDGGLGQYNNDLYQSNNQKASKNVEDSGERNTSDQKGDKYKKPRMNWTAELHQKFEMAVEQTGGVNKAVPKEILKCMQEEMNVQGVTRNNVASHLQKYRLNHEKTYSSVPQDRQEDSAYASADMDIPELINNQNSLYTDISEYFPPGLKNYSCVPQETREDSGWCNAGPNTALTASKELLNSSFNLQTRVPYFTNDQAQANAPIQCPSTNHLTMNNSHFMTNPLANLPHSDSFHLPQQQQDHQHQYNSISSLQSPSFITKQDSAYGSADMENPVLINNKNSLYDISEYFLPGLKSFDPA